MFWSATWNGLDYLEIISIRTKIGVGTYREWWNPRPLPDLVLLVPGQV